jgi:HPt (histidine-containing phosphotransfer) domain-containing protein
MAENIIPDNLVVLSRENAVINFSDDAALVDEMLQYFADSAPANIAKLKSAIDEKNYPVWISVAHLMKGESATLCMERINCITAKIEKAGKMQDNSEIHTMFELLEQEFAAFKKLLS